MKQKSLIAMSGGVDSSTAALLTKNMGYRCEGAIMRLNDVPLIEPIGLSRDEADAKSICDSLGIPFHVFDMREEFRRNVIDRFIGVYSDGATPNPCVYCNQTMKFGAFLDTALAMGMDCIVTGHYVNVEKYAGRYILKKAADKKKDQSYFLYTLSQHQLAHSLFPLGNMNKEEIRAIAEENGFTTSTKKDSQDICFVLDGNYIEVIKQYSDMVFSNGEFVNLSGDVIGTHSGHMNYTIGQRKGLGVGFGERLYVCQKDASTNRVVLGHNEDLFTSSLDAVDFNWIATDGNIDTFRCFARIRYASAETPVNVCVTGDDTVHIEFDVPQRAVASGQSVVLYDGDTVVGGGTIV